MLFKIRLNFSGFVQKNKELDSNNMVLMNDKLMVHKLSLPSSSCPSVCFMVAEMQFSPNIQSHMKKQRRPSPTPPTASYSCPTQPPAPYEEGTAQSRPSRIKGQARGISLGLQSSIHHCRNRISELKVSSTFF